ncbi:MAG: hypothetical protein U0326_04300 [Polyangiales bacterium]
MPGSPEIWRLVEAEVDAVAASEATTPRVDLQAASEVALTATGNLSDDAALLARFNVICATGEVAGDLLSRTQRLAGGAWYARHRQLKAEAAQTSEVVPEATLKRAEELFTRMQDLVSYHFKHDPEIGPEAAAMNRSPGHRKMANQLLSLSETYAKFPEKVATDPVNYRASDQRDARKTAGEIIKALSDSGATEVELWKGRSARVWSLLLRSYEELAALCRWLLRATPEAAAERFPSLFTESRSAPMARKPETPVTPPTPDANGVVAAPVAPPAKKTRRRAPR